MAGPWPTVRALRAPFTRRWALAWLPLLVGGPLAIVLFFDLGGFFDSFHGTVVCCRPLTPPSDRSWDRYVVDRPGRSRKEVLLPISAMQGADLPQCILGIPPEAPVPNAPNVDKNRASLLIHVGDEVVPSFRPFDVLLPLFLLALAASAEPAARRRAVRQVSEASEPGNDGE
jgi:hypothetical protein